MKTLKILPASLALVLAIPAAADDTKPARPAAGTAASKPAAGSKSMVERGKYLTILGGCNDCHTPKKMGPGGPEPDMSRLLSGHPQDPKLPAPPQVSPSSPWNIGVSGDLTAWAGPWGISYSPNLTPDTLTGLGVPGLWTEELFIKAMRTGKHIGTARPILPPMPWPNYAQATDQDLKAIWAYLGSIPPVRNLVPDPVIAPPPPQPGK
ncbi:MAG TPA: diheme cytochrome c-553 [Thermoanaerobaculia bacterium]|nr:diheme cytochrome c-553 [Thermoanaerobaculia bacterium]